MSLNAASGTLESTRCAHCGGSVRRDAPWCTLCLTPTRSISPPERKPEPAPDPEPPLPPAFSTTADEIDPLTAPLEQLLGAPAATPRRRHASAPTWPCASCSAPNPLELTTCATCGAGFLAAVARDEAPLLVLPLVGDVTQWSKLHWLGAGVVLLLGVLAVIVIVGALLG